MNAFFEVKGRAFAVSIGFSKQEYLFRDMNAFFEEMTLPRI